MYNTQYQYAHDIDWFILNGDCHIHCASNGGLLPNNIYSAIGLQSLQVAVEAMNPSGGFNLNKMAIEQNVRSHYENIDEESLQSALQAETVANIAFQADVPTWMKAYSWSFVRMAQRGFFSFDRIEGTNEYYLVAYPKEYQPLSGDIENLIYKVHIEQLCLFDYARVIANAYEKCNFVSEINRLERRNAKERPQKGNRQ